MWENILFALLTGFCVFGFGVIRSISRDITILAGCVSVVILSVGFFIGIGIGILTDFDQGMSVFLACFMFCVFWTAIDPFVIAHLQLWQKKRDESNKSL